MHITSRTRRLNQRGDTIVEVLLCISIISVILGGAYVATNRSYSSTRRAQEQSDAQKVSESQVEQLKGAINASGSTIFSAATPASFCMYNGNAVDASTAQCTVNATGVPTTAEPKYHVAIARSSNTFTLVTTWNDIRGGTTNRIQFSYRAYQ